MNIDIIKEKINELKGTNRSFRYNGSRNQIEEFDGIITSTYPAIFIIKSNNESKIRSFSYNDVINSNLEIIDNKKNV